MCTNPISITRRFPTGQCRVDVVPCGKCPECLKFKQMEFAALSIHQAMVSGTLYFFTLTYSDDHLPVSITDDDGRFLGFDNAFDSSAFYDSPTCFKNRVLRRDGLSYSASLRREDLKNWLKQFRIEFERKKGCKPQFKYCFFGELGEQRGRPHYHGLIYGASSEVASALADLWRKRFGFVCVVPPDFRQLDTNEIGKVSSYVSKYISKGVCSRFSHLLPYIERPRRVCSRNFGDFSLDELKRLRDYYDGVDLHHLSRALFCEEVLKRRYSFVVNGNSFPLPLRLKQKLFYEERNSDRGSSERSGSEEISFRCPARKTPVSSLLSSFSRRRDYLLLDQQLRENSERNPDVSPRKVIDEMLFHEIRSREARSASSSENILTNLKNQKDGQ